MNTHSHALAQADNQVETVTHVFAQIHSQSAQSLTLTHFNTASLVAEQTTPWLVADSENIKKPEDETVPLRLLDKYLW